MGHWQFQKYFRSVSSGHLIIFILLNGAAIFWKSQLHALAVMWMNHGSRIYITLSDNAKNDPWPVDLTSLLFNLDLFTLPGQHSNHCFGEESSALQPPLPSQHSCLIHSWICKSSRSISFCLQHEHKACGHITCARSNCSTTSYQSYWSSVCWAGYRAAVCTSSHGTPQVGKDWRHREWLSALS